MKALIVTTLLALPAAAMAQAVNCSVYPSESVMAQYGYGAVNCAPGSYDGGGGECDMGVGSEAAEVPIGPGGSVAWGEPIVCMGSSQNYSDPDVSLSDPPSGVTAGPEIDPHGTTGALTLLVGTLAVLRGRRGRA